VGVNGLILARLVVEDEEPDPSLCIGLGVRVAALVALLGVKAGELALKVALAEEEPAGPLRHSMLLGHDPDL
jgi:hypothetical protein